MQIALRKVAGGFASGAKFFLGFPRKTRRWAMVSWKTGKCFIWKHKIKKKQIANFEEIVI